MYTIDLSAKNHLSFSNLVLQRPSVTLLVLLNKNAYAGISEDTLAGNEDLDEKNAERFRVKTIIKNNGIMTSEST